MVPFYNVSFLLLSVSDSYSGLKLITSLASSIKN